MNVRCESNHRPRSSTTRALIQGTMKWKDWIALLMLDNCSQSDKAWTKAQMKFMRSTAKILSSLLIPIYKNYCFKSEWISWMMSTKGSNKANSNSNLNLLN